MLVGIFDHDDGGIHHGPDGNGDAPQAHDVGIEALTLHDDETDQNPHRQGENDHKGAAQVEQEDRANHRHDQAFLHEGSLQRVDGPQDQAGAVVDFPDAHALGQPRFNFRNPFFHIADHLQGVFAVAHDHDPAHHLAGAVVLGDTAADFRAHPHRGDVAQQNWRAAIVNAEGNIANIIEAPDVAAAAHHELRFPHLHHATAHIAVAALDGHAHFLQREIVGQQLVGLHHDLVLLDEPADGSHLGHAVHAGQFVAQEPVLDGAQLGQIVPVALQGVGVDPAHPGGVRPQARGDAGGQPAGDEIEVFEHAAAGPVHVGAVFENDVDERNTEERIPPYHTGVRYREHGRGQGIRHLVFDHLRCLTRILRKDDDLDVRQVGDGIQWNAGHGVKASGNHEKGRQNDKKLILYGRFDYSINHRSTRLSFLQSFTPNVSLRNGPPPIVVKTYRLPPSRYRSCPVHHPY